ncbi:uncharacterized protein LOC122084802 [Macadamia integrifolia]|uniref:uncharacterized protein LOC122084802 n=1 Tax=Macadamia integrifolia TaxID=60698 RepID=UPI001C501AC6|nr:uncharacterized protein LOC122084802 [Macadamia integrifolia]
MDHEDFDRVVASSWTEWISGSPIFVLMNKLKRLKEVLKTWARPSFPHLDRALDDAKNVLSLTQDQIEREGMNEQLFALETDVKTALVKALENHERIWAEKDQLGDIVVDFYERFHRATPTMDHVELLDCIPRILNQVDCYSLDLLLGNTKIRRVVWELDPDSSPGLDGFSVVFFRKCWSTVEMEVCNVVRQFFSSCSMPHGVNNNFLVLIPKVDGADTLDKFQPLCMGNIFCKIISKVMALRLETLLLRLISEEQGAFQEGKMIHDNIVASELVNLIFSMTGGGGLGLKIDIRKAYDTIS